MEELVKEFECIVVIKTIMEGVDYNFILIKDLDKIINLADELKIDLDCRKYINICDDCTSEDLIEVCNDWYDEICTMHDQVFDKLVKSSLPH